MGKDSSLKKVKTPSESRSDTLDAFVRAREEDPVLQDELSVGELIAIARYHLDYIIGLGFSGQCESTGDDRVIPHLEEVLMMTAQALSIYRKKR
jgi:hypothetical protein